MEPLPLTAFHTENEERPLARKKSPVPIKEEAYNRGIDVLGPNEEVDRNRWAMRTSPGFFHLCRRLLAVERYDTISKTCTCISAFPVF